MSEPQHVSKRNLRCSKCGSKKLLLREYMVTSGEYHFDNGVITEGYPSEKYSSDGVRAECDCGHTWMLKKVYDITTLYDE